MIVCEHGFVIVCEHGFVIVCEHGFVIVCEHGFVIVCEHGFNQNSPANKGFKLSCMSKMCVYQTLIATSHHL